MDNITPPPMPEPAHSREAPDFTSDQLTARDQQWLAIVKEAVLAEREACAAECDAAYHRHIGPTHGEVRYGIAACAAAIRSRSTT